MYSKYYLAPVVEIPMHNMQHVCDPDTAKITANDSDWATGDRKIFLLPTIGKLIFT